MAATLSSTPVWKAQTRDLRTDLDLTRDELSYLLELTAKVKSTPARYYEGADGPVPDSAVRKAFAAHPAHF